MSWFSTHHKVCDLSGKSPSIQIIINIEDWNPRRTLYSCLQHYWEEENNKSSSIKMNWEWVLSRKYLLRWERCMHKLTAIHLVRMVSLERITRKSMTSNMEIIHLTVLNGRANIKQSFIRQLNRIPSFPRSQDFNLPFPDLLIEVDNQQLIL